MQVLSRAEGEFVQGHFFGLSSILNDCLQGNQMTAEQKVRAYKLLAQAYLLTDDPVAAEDSYLKLLQVDPEYVSSEATDPVDIYYLSQKFITTPRFTQTLGSFGFNVFEPRLIERNSPFYNAKYSEALRLGFQVSTGIDYNVTRKLSIGAELMYVRQSYTGVITEIFPSFSSQGASDELTVVERQNWLELPLFVRYTHNVGKIRPFGYAGIALTYIFRSSAELNYVDRTSADEGQQVGEVRVQGPDVNTTFLRNQFNRSVVFGAGLRYKVSKNFLVFDVRYTLGLTNITNPDNVFYNDANSDVLNNEITQYAFISDSFRGDRIALSIGWIKPLYQPRKVRKPMVKSVKQKSNK